MPSAGTWPSITTGASPGERKANENGQVAARDLVTDELWVDAVEHGGEVRCKPALPFYLASRLAARREGQVRCRIPAPGLDAGTRGTPGPATAPPCLLTILP
jgi:hypothetical protein